jgi:hypothetical protein
MSGLSQKRRTTQPTSVTTVKGQDGAPGSKIYRDSGAPIDSLGNNGDYYINQTTGQYYGPKAAGTWSGVGPYDFVTSEAITGQTGATPTTGDFFLFSDTSDSGTLKKVDASVLLSGGGSFDGLSDTPANKTGHALKVIRVNAGETALEYVTLSGGGDMLKSTYDTNDDGTVNDSDNLGGNSSAWHLDRANHGGTQTAATISDFDTEVSNNTDVADNTSKAHTQGSDLALDTGNANEVTAADLRAHLDDAGKHREINDAGTGATDLWSADKISTEIANAGGTLTHDSKSADFTVDSTYNKKLVEVDYNGSDIEVTMPNPAPAGMYFKIAAVTSGGYEGGVRFSFVSTNYKILDGTISGYVLLSLKDNEAASVYSDGSGNWYVIPHNRAGAFGYELSPFSSPLDIDEVKPGHLAYITATSAFTINLQSLSSGYNNTQREYTFIVNLGFAGSLTFETEVGPNNFFLYQENVSLGNGQTHTVDRTKYPQWIAVKLSRYGQIWNAYIINLPGTSPRTKTLGMVVEAPGTTDHTTGDNVGDIGIDIPDEFDGWRVTGGFVRVQTAGTTGTEDHVIRRVRSGGSTDVITALNIASTETRVEGGTVSTASSNDIVATGDLFELDRDAVQTTAAKGWTMYGIYLSEY